MRRTSQDIIAIGQKLIKVKQHLGQVNWSISTINKFMQVGEQFKFVNFTNLNITASALYLLAAPSTHKEARVEGIDSTIQIFPLSLDRDIRLVNPPRVVSWLQVISSSFIQFGCISLYPTVHRSMIHRESPLQHHFF